MNIRQHIINNFRDDNIESLREVIDESINEQDEITLPGMGVFFEIVWKNTEEDVKNKILEVLKNNLSK